MKTILCYGDSNTYGYNPDTGKRYDTNTRWPCVLRHLLGPDYEVVEEGCNGRTASYKDSKEPWKTGDYALETILNSHKPVDIFILMLGTNDLKKVYPGKPDEIIHGIIQIGWQAEDFLEEKQGYEPQILLVSPTHITDGEHPLESFDESAQEKSKELSQYYKHNACLNMWQFLDAASLFEPSKTDGVHWTAENHQAFAKALVPIIENMWGIQ